jgi:hypothetical protein
VPLPGGLGWVLLEWVEKIDGRLSRSHRQRGAPKTLSSGSKFSLDFPEIQPAGRPR